VTCVSFAYQQNIVVSGSQDETVRYWDVRSGKCLRIITAHSETVTSVSFSRDGTLILSSGYDGVARIWDVYTGQCLKTLQVNGSTICCDYCCFTPNYKYILTSYLNGQMRLWDFVRGRTIKLYETDQSSRYTSNSVISDGMGKDSDFVIKCTPNSLSIFNIQSQKILSTISVAKPMLGVDLYKNQLIACGGLEKTIQIYKLNSL
jgi:COMPASS component SWD3